MIRVLGKEEEEDLLTSGNTVEDTRQTTIP